MALLINLTTRQVSENVRIRNDMKRGIIKCQLEESGGTRFWIEISIQGGAPSGQAGQLWLKSWLLSHVEVEVEVLRDVINSVTCRYVGVLGCTRMTQRTRGLGH